MCERAYEIMSDSEALDSIRPSPSGCICEEAKVSLWPMAHAAGKKLSHFRGEVDFLIANFYSQI